MDDEEVRLHHHKRDSDEPYHRHSRSNDRGRTYFGRTGMEIFLTLLPTIIGVLVMAGGWVASYATLRAATAEQDRRITELETAMKGMLPRAEHDKVDAERDKAFDRLNDSINEVAKQLRDHDARFQEPEVIWRKRERRKPRPMSSNRLPETVVPSRHVSPGSGAALQ